MSRFIDKLNQTSQAVPQSIGFKAAMTVSPKPKMLLVASLAEADVERVADYVAGADAGLLSIPKSSPRLKVLEKVAQAVSGIPWGGWLKDIDVEGMGQSVKAGSDFVVFPAATTLLTIAQNEEVGKILEVEVSLGEGLLKAVNELPVDAVLISSQKKESLTWHHLMLFQRLADLLTKPLLASVPSNVSASELLALWAAGVDGVVVEVGVGQPVERVSKLRQAIDELAFPSKRKRGKAEALLPYIGAERDTVAEEEEE